MGNDLTKNFRSYKEMDLIYQDLYKKGMVNQPYIVTISKSNQLLIFYGARHSNNTKDTQNAYIEKEWNKFLVNKNGNKIALCEGGLRPKEKSKIVAIKKYSEPGLLTWLANRDNVRISSPEPDETKEIKYLHENGYSAAEIMTYYFGRQMYQWLKRDYLNYPDWQKYADRHIKSYAKLIPFQESNITTANVLKMFKEITGSDFNKNDEELLYRLSTPTSNPVSAASGVFRDISLYKSIRSAWNQGKDIFSLYGSGHAIILENVLREL